ncbi:MAG: hypothetical protein E7667_07420 [Ruminococcaceae bacterium]|nr:hypothetical protein [Oscillospiraceae bacterium]
MKPTKNQIFSYLRNLFVGLFASIVALLFASRVTLANYSVINEGGFASQDHGYGWVLFVRIFALLLNVFVVGFVFFYFDNLDLFNKKEYFYSENKKHLLLEKRYWIYLAISLPLSTAMFSSNIRFLLGHFTATPNIGLCSLLSLILFVSMRAIQIHALYRKWNNEILYPHLKSRAAFKRNSKMEEFKLRQLFLQPLGFFIIGTLVCAFLINLLLMFAYPIILLLKEPLSLLYLAIVILVLAAVPFLIYTIHNVVKRRKLLKYLKKLEKDGIAKITYNGHKIISAFFPSMIFEITATHKSGKKYTATIVSCGKMGSPMYFKKDEFLIERGFRFNSGALMSTRMGTGFAQAVDISKLGEDENPTNLILGYNRAYDISFANADGEKSLILNPTPTRAFIIDAGNKAHPIDTGMKAFDYTVYTASGFYNMMNLS